MGLWRIQMEMSARQWEFNWRSLALGVLIVMPGFLYARLSRVSRTHGSSGMDLTAVWWLLILLYLLVDIAMLTFVLYMFGKRIVGVSQARKFIRCGFPEILRVLLVWHLVLFVWEYPVSSRLEGVGLGSLETIIFVIFIVMFVPMCARVIRRFRDQELYHTSNQPSRPLRIDH
jgi:hypothetical protein